MGFGFTRINVRMDIKFILLILLAGFYLVAGISHFVFPKFYYKAMPPFAKSRAKELNTFVGIAEILAAIGLLLPATRMWAAIGVIILLIGVLPVHTHMVRDPNPAFKVPRWLLWARIPIQFVLLAWAAWYIV